MIRLFAGAAALALPAAAAAQEGTSSGPSDEIVFADYRIDPYDIVVRGGLLPHNQDDGVQSSAILRNLDPGFGARVENRLRDEAGIVQFRRSDGRSAHPTSQGVTLRGLGGNASSRALVTLDGVPIRPGFGLGSWVAFHEHDGHLMAMGDLVLLEREIAPVMRRLAEGGLEPGQPGFLVVVRLALGPRAGGRACGLIQVCQSAKVS